MYSTGKCRCSDSTLSSTNISEKLPYLGECLDTSKLDREERQHVFESEVKPGMTWSGYWKLIRDAKTVTGNCKYPNLVRFVAILASFPFPNAVVERALVHLNQN